MRIFLPSRAPRGLDRSRRGVSLVLVVFAVTAVGVLAVSLVTLNALSLRESRASRERLAAQYVAEAGMALAYRDLADGGTGAIASEQNPRPYGPASFWVESVDLGGNLTSLTATSLDDRSGARVQAVLRRNQSNLWAWGAFGDEGLTMDSNAMVDSYNSSLGPYADVNGSGNDTYASSNGDVGSNGDITLSQNSTVHGDATPGVGGTISVLGNATVTGSTVSATAPFDMPPLDVPSLPSSGPLTIAGGTTGTLASGDHRFTNFELETGATLTITGPATIVMNDFTMDSNSELRVDASLGPVDIYVIDDYVINSNTLIASTTYDPLDLRFYLESDNVLDPAIYVDVDEVDFDSNAQLYGTIYAPNASIDINSNFELFGAIVARRVHLDSNSKIHFDENLLTATQSSAQADLVTMSWQVAPYRAMGITH